jgi:hypothetical protein
MGQAKNVWTDFRWLPLISYSVAERALPEWLEVVPSSRILRGSDLHRAEGIYAATQSTRRCLGEALAEKAARSYVSEPKGPQIGTQIMCGKELKVFSASPRPPLERLGPRHKGKIAELRTLGQALPQKAYRH